MSRFMRKLVRRNTGPDRPDSRGSGLTSSDVAAQRKDTLDRELDAFCDTARWNNEGDEYIHLPAIVDSAESSPEAARHAAVKIRRILSKSTPQQSYRQYNAIMLMRILLNNPGTPFSAGFDEKFVAAVKKVLRECQDVMVQSIMRETLEWMEKEKLWDMNLRALLEAWRKEKRETQKLYGRMAAMPTVPSSQPLAHQSSPSINYSTHPRRQRRRSLSRGRTSRPSTPPTSSTPRPPTLPPPDELAARISEANNTAKLLEQVIQSTPASQFASNELLGEFNSRCQAAAESMQGYLNAKDPAPDEETMLLLIETTEELAVTLSRYRRAALAARRINAVNTEEEEVHEGAGGGMLMPMPMPTAPAAVGSGYGHESYEEASRNPFYMPNQPTRPRTPEAPPLQPRVPAQSYPHSTNPFIETTPTQTTSTTPTAPVPPPEPAPTTISTGTANDSVAAAPLDLPHHTHTPNPYFPSSLTLDHASSRSIIDAGGYNPNHGRPQKLPTPNPFPTALSMSSIRDPEDELEWYSYSERERERQREKERQEQRYETIDERENEGAGHSGRERGRDSIGSGYATVRGNPYAPAPQTRPRMQTQTYEGSYTVRERTRDSIGSGYATVRGNPYAPKSPGATSERAGNPFMSLRRRDRPVSHPSPTRDAETYYSNPWAGDGVGVTVAPGGYDGEYAGREERGVRNSWYKYQY